jgi:hypothetical protein
MLCKRYDIEVMVSGRAQNVCSKQVSIFNQDLCESCLKEQIPKRILDPIPGQCEICRSSILRYDLKGKVRKENIDRTKMLICPNCLIALAYQAKEQGDDYDREAYLAEIMGTHSQNEGVLFLEALPVSTVSLNGLKDDCSVLDEKYLDSETSEQINYEEVQNYGN